MNTNRFSIQDQGTDFASSTGSKRFRILDTNTGVVATWTDTLAEAEALIAQYSTPIRKTASRRALDRGRSYGVNGQIWDEDI